MTPELLVLLAASMVALQIVSLILRREHVEDAPYLGLLVVDLATLVYAHLTGRQDSLIAFVGEGIAVMLTFAPRALDAMERAALMRDAFARAARVAMVRELLTPGRTAARRRRQLFDLAQTRAGGGAGVARRLRAELDRIDDPVRAARLREDLATVLFFDQRFAEGVAEIERHVDLAEIGRRPAFAAYLLRAYGEVGRLDRAAEIMGALEDGPLSRDPAGLGLITQARLTFLAFTGRLPDVEALLAIAPGSRLPPRAQEFLVGVARQRRTVEAPPVAQQMAETVLRRAVAPTGPARSSRHTPMTLALVAANVLAFAVVHDDLLLVRAGALFRPAVLSGEWWRLATAMFLHGGEIHLAVNMYGLYLLGRFTEEVFGPARFLAVYLSAGLVGAMATTTVGAGPLSVGASGAIMGILGALIVTLVLRRGSWPEQWRRSLLIMLTLIGALQIFIGFQVVMIDNAAHVGGMLGGAAATVILAPGGLLGDGRAGRAMVRLVAALLVAFVVISAAMVLRTPIDRTLARIPTHEVQVNGVTLDVPEYWVVDTEHGQIEDPYLDIRIKPTALGRQVEIGSPQANDPRYRSTIERIAASARPVILKEP